MKTLLCLLLPLCAYSFQLSTDTIFLTVNEPGIRKPDTLFINSTNDPIYVDSITIKPINVNAPKYMFLAGIAVCQGICRAPMYNCTLGTNRPSYIPPSGPISVNFNDVFEIALACIDTCPCSYFTWLNYSDTIEARLILYSSGFSDSILVCYWGTRPTSVIRDINLNGHINSFRTEKHSVSVQGRVLKGNRKKHIRLLF